MLLEMDYATLRNKDGKNEEIRAYVDVLCKAFVVCQGVTTILVPKEWMVAKQRFLEVFRLEDVETDHNNGKQVLLGRK
jgi:hypothetical protein